jgi:hypothetical protein
MIRRGRRGPQGAPGDEFAEFVRRSLHAAADQVEPSADGLDKIRDKIRSGPVYASASDPEAGRMLPGSGLPGLVRRLTGAHGEHSAPRGHGQVPGRPGTAPGRGTSPGHARPARRRPMDWREAMLRPALAIGVAVFAVAVVLAAVPPLRQAFVQVSTDVFAGGSPSTSASAPGTGSGHSPGASLFGGSASEGSTSAPSAAPCASPTQPHASGSAKSGAASPTASASQPTSPSATTQQSPSSPSQTSSTASPSGSASTSASPSASATSSASADASPSSSATGSASPSASAQPSASPSTSTSPSSKAKTTSPTPSASCSSQAPTGSRSATPSKSANATSSGSPSVEPDPSPSTPDSSQTGTGLNPYSAGSADASG